MLSARLLCTAWKCGSFYKQAICKDGRVVCHDIPTVTTYYFQIPNYFLNLNTMSSYVASKGPQIPGLLFTLFLSSCTLTRCTDSSDPLPQRRIRILNYWNTWLLMYPQRTRVVLKFIVSYLELLALCLNWTKRSLLPSQKTQFLGLLVNSGNDAHTREAAVTEWVVLHFLHLTFRTKSMVRHEFMLVHSNWC